MGRVVRTRAEYLHAAALFRGSKLGAVNEEDFVNKEGQAYRYLTLDVRVPKVALPSVLGKLGELALEVDGYLTVSPPYREDPHCLVRIGVSGPVTDERGADA